MNIQKLKGLLTDALVAPPEKARAIIADALFLLGQLTPVAGDDELSTAAIRGTVIGYRKSGDANSGYLNECRAERPPFRVPRNVLLEVASAIGAVGTDGLRFDELEQRVRAKDYHLRTSLRFISSIMPAILAKKAGKRYASLVDRQEFIRLIKHAWQNLEAI